MFLPEPSPFPSMASLADPSLWSRMDTGTGSLEHVLTASMDATWIGQDPDGGQHGDGADLDPTGFISDAALAQLDIVDPVMVSAESAQLDAQDIQGRVLDLLQTLSEAADSESDPLGDVPPDHLEALLLLFLDQHHKEDPSQHTDASTPGLATGSGSAGMPKASPTLLTEKEKQEAGKTIPCTYFRLGNCRRSNCYYSHDLKAISCRFYAAGWCRDGEDCVFHHDPVDLVRAAIRALRRGESTLLTEDMLAQAERTLCDSRTRTSDPSDTAEQAPARPPDLDEASFPSLGRDNSAAVAPSRSSASMGAWARAPPQLPRSSASTRAVSSLSLLPTAASRRRGVRRPRMAVVLQPWVETGVAVSQQYEDLRSRAVQHAMARNKLFQQAAQVVSCPWAVCVCVCVYVWVCVCVRVGGG